MTYAYRDKGGNILSKKYSVEWESIVEKADVTKGEALAVSFSIKI